MTTTSQPLTPAEAIAQLKRELPAFAGAEAEINKDYEKAWTVVFRLEETATLTLIREEMAVDESAEELQDSWELSVQAPNTLVRSGLPRATLAAAIAALKSAAAEQQRVLELVNPGRAETVARANRILKELVEMTPREKGIFKVEEPELVAKLIELLT